MRTSEKQRIVVLSAFNYLIRHRAGALAPEINLHVRATPAAEPMYSSLKAAPWKITMST